MSKYTQLPGSTIARMHRGKFAESTDLALVQPVVDVAPAYGLASKPFAARELYRST